MKIQSLQDILTDTFEGLITQGGYKCVDIVKVLRNIANYLEETYKG